MTAIELRWLDTITTEITTSIRDPEAVRGLEATAREDSAVSTFSHFRRGRLVGGGDGALREVGIDSAGRSLPDDQSLCVEHESGSIITVSSMSAD